jgi:hypothetical protein
MKKLILVLAIMVGACATTPAVRPDGQATAPAEQIAFYQECLSYYAALSIAQSAYNSGKLNAAQTTQLKTISATISPICSGPLPTNPQDATNKVAAAVTALGAYEVIMKAK